MKTLFLLLIALGIPALAYAQDQAAQMAAGCGPKDIRFEVSADASQHPKGQPAPGEALAYFFDPRGGLSDDWPPARVGVDGAWVGANKKESYFFFSVAPGSHNLCADKQVVTTFSAEPGQIYYFTVLTHRSGTEKLVEITPAEAELQIGKLSFSTFTPKPSKSRKP
jgi:hypothetical protein